MSFMAAKKMLLAGSRLRPQDVFATSLYSGNGGAQTITNGLDLAGKGGLVWIKYRNAVGDHLLTDTLRGAGRTLVSAAKQEERNFNSVSQFTANGFVDSLGYGSQFNMVAWSFRQADKFFDIRLIQHTTGTASTISLPSFGPIGMVIGKNRSDSGNWPVWHRSLSAGRGLQLNLTGAASSTEAWISVSGQTITLSSDAPSGSYVLYIFAHSVERNGIIQCVAASSDASGATNIQHGWDAGAQFVLMKPFGGTNQTGPWDVFDQARSPEWEGADLRLEANSMAAEVNNPRLQENSLGTLRVSSAPNTSNLYLIIRKPT